MPDATITFSEHGKEILRRLSANLGVPSRIMMDEPERLAIAYLPEEGLATIFNWYQAPQDTFLVIYGIDVPPNARVERTFLDPCRRVIGVVLSHPSFSEVGQGEQLPVVGNSGRCVLRKVPVNHVPGENVIVSSRTAPWDYFDPVREADSPGHPIGVALNKSLPDSHGNHQVEVFLNGVDNAPPPVGEDESSRDFFRRVMGTPPDGRT